MRLMLMRLLLLHPMLMRLLLSFVRSSTLTILYQVKRMRVAQRENPIVNRLNKTKVEKFPDLRQEKEDRLKELRGQDRAAQQSRVSLQYLIRTL